MSHADTVRERSFYPYSMVSYSPLLPLDRLLATTERLIYAGGIHATGMDAIVKESGVPRKTVYRHFSSKEALVVGALKRRDDRWMDWFIHETTTRASTPHAQLLVMFAVLRNWFESADFHGCAFINAAGEIAHPSPIRDIARHHKQRLLDFIEQLCRQLGTSEPQQLARQLLVLIDGAIAVAMVQGDGVAADDAATIAKHLLASLTNRLPPGAQPDE
jgi:AcrR family transcriptional regulator